MLFVPFRQDAGQFITYMVRTAGDPDRAIGAARAALRNADPQLITILPITMDQIIAQSPSVFLRRYPSFLIGSLALLALILATVGLYGLISYSVSQRTRELGSRMALVAQPGDMVRLVLGEGARLTAIGVGIGVFAALTLTQLMRSLLFGVSAVDSCVMSSASDPDCSAKRGSASNTASRPRKPSRMPMSSLGDGLKRSLRWASAQSSLSRAAAAGHQPRKKIFHFAPQDFGSNQDGGNLNSELFCFESGSSSPGCGHLRVPRRDWNYI